MKQILCKRCKDFKELIEFSKGSPSKGICNSCKDFLDNNVITWKEARKRLGEERYHEFLEWMRGSTCVKEGCYFWDLERFEAGSPVIY